ncbi:hypothetical protein GGD65_005304 [Bradyrhizobium sp. CIR18]|nr:hypothetical protein [Bradyrhizobium sp. CIR18]
MSIARLSGQGGHRNPSDRGRQLPAAPSHASSRRFSNYFPGCSRASGHPTSQQMTRSARQEEIPMKHTPLEARLARADRRSDLRRLQDYAAPHAPTAWFAANDNEVGSAQVDRVVEIRPSPREQIRIAVKDAIKTRGDYGPITPAELDAAARRNIRWEAREWLGSDGKWRPMTELFRQSKGGRRARPMRSGRPTMSGTLVSAAVADSGAVKLCGARLRRRGLQPVSGGPLGAGPVCV